MLFLMKKMLLRSGITTIFAIYLDFFKFSAINEFWRVILSKKRVLCWLDKICHCCLGKKVQSWKTLGRNVRHLQENKQTSRKWRGLFLKIPESMHKVLSYEKDAIEVTTIFVIYIYWYFAPLKKSALSAGWVQFGTTVLCRNVHFSLKDQLIKDKFFLNCSNSDKMLILWWKQRIHIHDIRTLPWSIQGVTVHNCRFYCILHVFYFSRT